MITFFKPFTPAPVYLFLFLTAGILSGNVAPVYKTPAFWSVLALSFLLCLKIWYTKKKCFPLFLVLIFSIGFYSIQARLYPDLPSNHISFLTGSGKVRITGKIISFARHHKKKTSYTLLCQSIERKNGRKKKTKGKINLNIYGVSETILRYGDCISFNASIKVPHNFGNPGRFDYERFLRLEQIFGNASASAKKISVLPPSNDLGFRTTFFRKIENFRNKFYDFIVRDHTDTGKIIAALITGKKEIIPLEIRDLFSKAGISHLLAISGLHLSIVSLLFFSFFYKVLSVIPGLLISGNSKKIAGITTIVPLFFYAVFSGFSPSTQRALIMIIVLLFSYISEKEKDLLSSLSIAGILILIMDAAALFSISFQLSFMAVIFIFTGFSLLKRFPLMSKNTLMGKVGLMIWVAFFAGLGTMPLTSHYFNMISYIQPVSNLFAIPVLGFVVLPLGLIVLVCFSYFPLGAALILQGCSQLVLFLISFARYLVALPFSWSRTIPLQWMEIIIIYLIMVSLFFLLKAKYKHAVLILAAGIVLTGYNFFDAGFKKNADPDLQITIIDVGQGSSALVQTSDGKNILVDGGGFSDRSSFDTGRFIIAPFLWHKRIFTLEYVVLTHPESDHLNGLIYILQNFNVRTVIKNLDKRRSSNYQALINTCKEKTIPILNPLKKGGSLDLGRIKLLFYPQFNTTALYGLNNNSLVFKLTYKKFSMLFPGDILSLREEKLSSVNTLPLSSDVLLSPHHGSNSSSSKLFLDKVRPKSVIISCGWHNRYGFPHDQVLNRYQKRGIDIFRTDENGAISVSSDGKTYSIKTFKGN